MKRHPRRTLKSSRGQITGRRRMIPPDTHLPFKRRDTADHMQVVECRYSSNIITYLHFHMSRGIHGVIRGTRLIMEGSRALRPGERGCVVGAHPPVILRRGGVSHEESRLIRPPFWPFANGFREDEQFPRSGFFWPVFFIVAISEIGSELPRNTSPFIIS